MLCPRIDRVCDVLTENILVSTNIDVDARIMEIAVHPQKRNQFSILAWAHKVVYVIEPLHELGGEWVCKANQGVGGQIRID